MTQTDASHTPCILMSILFVTVSASYIKPCARSEPDFNACALQHAKETFPVFVKGKFPTDCSRSHAVCACVEV
jgi:hypothetical protein